MTGAVCSLILQMCVEESQKGIDGRRYSIMMAGK